MKTENNEQSWSERHPKLNAMIGLIVIGIAIYAVVVTAMNIYAGVVEIISAVSNLDAVVIVALITGGLSFVGVVISKMIDYFEARREYLTQKREEPYGQFIDMVYKIQRNAKEQGLYTEEQMLADVVEFSKGITLWGSPRVVNKWVKFRENGANPESAYENMFVLEDIMNAMRKDLGLRKVPKGNLLAFFVNDIKETMKNAKKG
jgi:flagellar motor component MotA